MNFSMGVRDYRPGDGPGIADLWRRNPTQEFPVLGLQPSAIEDVLRRTDRPRIRFVLALARLLGRPIIARLVVDLGGQIAGTTLISFTPEVGYVSGVSVDAPVRHRGHGRALMQATDDICRKYNRLGPALDVFIDNLPAIRLYDRWGYERLRDQSWMSRDFGPATPVPAPAPETPIRPVESNDARALAEIDNALMPPAVRAVMPRHPQNFRISATVDGILQSESAGWVVVADGQPAGWIQATVSQLMDAANLSSLILDRRVSDAAGRDLVLTALRWLERKGAPRVVTEMPEHQWARRPILESLGFVERFRSHTMVHRLTA